jgi:hypothetical protein
VRSSGSIQIALTNEDNLFYGIITPKIVFDKNLSKYYLFDLFSAIKHKRKEIRRNR